MGRLGLALLVATLAILGPSCAAGDGDGNGDGTPWQDGDETGDSRTGEDGDDDSGGGSVPDDYLAPWPQDPLLPSGYDESPEPGPLRAKAEVYDLWHRTWHQPDYGGNAHARFVDETYSAVTGYEGIGDSCIWTGTYLGGQAMRYRVTGDPAALDNVRRMVRALDGFLHVTGTPGFIARYRGSQALLPLYGGDGWCDGYSRCHRVTDGPYAGDFWVGETSRDQYTGWFFGMALAYDVDESEETRATIRADVSEVLNTLIDQDWTIRDEADEPTDAAPQVLLPMQMAWLVVGYHVTGDGRFATEMRARLLDSRRTALRLATIALPNRYAQYYGNNLSHTNWYTLLRLGRVYFGDRDFQFLQDVFEEQVHSFTRLSHNPWFTAIYVGQGRYVPSPGDPYAAQIAQDLAAFPDPPNREYFLPARDPATYELDPLSVFLDDLQTRFPILEDWMGAVDPQALAAFPVDLQCSGGFLFQHNPFRIGACGEDDPLQVQSGHDYLAAYWTASFHGVLSKGQ
jgi:hypothetical protein